MIDDNLRIEQSHSYCQLMDNDLVPGRFKCAAKSQRYCRFFNNYQLRSEQI